MAEYVALLLRAPFVWIGQQRNRWREWRDVDGRVLAAIRDGHSYASNIADVTRLSSGRMYPALARLERAGRIAGRWDREWGVARRRLYSVVDEVQT